MLQRMLVLFGQELFMSWELLKKQEKSMSNIIQVIAMVVIQLIIRLVFVLVYGFHLTLVLGQQNGKNGIALEEKLRVD